MNKKQTKAKKAKKAKKMNDKEAILLLFFPPMFFILGLLIATFSSFYDNWKSWVVLGAGMIVYYGIYKWYLGEVTK